MIGHLASRGKGAVHRPIAPVFPQAGPNGRVTMDDAYAYCEAFTRTHHENFPVASWFLPARLRRHVLALYAFARSANDLADGGAKELDRWEDLLHRAFHGEAEHPILVALSDTVQQFDLPITIFESLIAAFQMDLRVRRYATWRDLEAYTQVAARPVGSGLLYLFGTRDPERHRFADELSTALALTNFWQDLGRDLGRDRIYVPLEDLRFFGVLEEDLFARRQTPRLEALLRYECSRTRSLFERARPLVQLVEPDLAVEVAMFWYGGRRALDKIENRAHDVFGPRIRLSTTDKAWVLAKALRARGLR